MEMTVTEAKEAFVGLRRINETVKLLPKSAWLIADILVKMRNTIQRIEDTEAKLMKDAGGVRTTDGGMSLQNPVRTSEMTDDEFRKLIQQHSIKVTALTKDLEEIRSQMVVLDIKPIKRDVFSGQTAVHATDLAAIWVLVESEPKNDKTVTDEKD